MASIQLKNQDGVRVGDVELASSLLESPVTHRLLRDAYVMYEACRRQGTVSVKTKGQIVGSKKKLFRQKGTGNARAGQKRTPLRRGGGNAFGRVSKNWNYRLPKKALKVAARMALVEKLTAGEVVLVDEFQLASPKTKEVAALMGRLSVSGKSCLMVVGAYDRVLWLSTRNIPRLSLTTSAWVNSYDLLKHRVVLMTRHALEGCLDRFKS